MRESFSHSIRVKNTVYGTLSLVLAVLTALLFAFSINFVYRLGTKKDEVRQENLNNYSNTNAAVSDKLTAVNPVQKGRNPGVETVTIIMSTIVMFLSYICYFSLFTKKYDDYLEKIKNGVTELAAGNFEVKIPLHEQDELTDIAREINFMAKEIRTLMQEEKRTENKKNALITNVAHDLRTPLTSIIGYLQLAKKEEITKKEQSHYIRIAYDKSMRLEKLISDLFTYTKLEFGDVKLKKTKVDVVKLLEQMLEEFYPSFKDAGLIYSFTTNVKSAVIMADGDLLARAFENLISNAIRYGANGKNVNVIVHVTFDRLKVQIVNYGEIIKEKDLKLIFEKFYRVDSSRNEERGGTGLGLSIAQNIIKMHDGVIQATSGVEGTVFEVILDGCEEA